MLNDCEKSWRNKLSSRKEVKINLIKSIIKGDDHCLFELQITENDI